MKFDYKLTIITNDVFICKKNRPAFLTRDYDSDVNIINGNLSFNLQIKIIPFKERVFLKPFSYVNII